jgi:nicotinamide-nucleotide amidase
MLPGVPREMRGMLADELMPLVRERALREAGSAAEPPVVRSRTLRTTAIAESAIADRLGPLARGVDGLSLAYLPGHEGVDLRLTARHLPAADADAALTRGVEALRGHVGQWAYAEDAGDMASVVLELCRRAGHTLAVAESCTGGMIGSRLTAIPGSSDVFLGGTIAYANSVKTGDLGVPAAMLEEHGAVSEPVARRMASGVRARLGAGVAIAVTGVAGPGGGTEEKPVGTTWIAVDVAGEVRTQRSVFIGDRAEIRFRASQLALELVRRALAAVPAATP